MGKESRFDKMSYQMIYCLQMMDIKEIRKKLGLTQTQMAKKLGVAFVSVNRWENDWCKPSQLALKELQRLAKKVSKMEAEK